MKYKMPVILLGLGVAAVLLVLGGLSLRGRGIRMAAEHRVQALLEHRRTLESQAGTSVVFLHHSVGHNLIRQGMVREKLTGAGLQFWDHDYNYEGLIRPDGTRAGYSYGIPDDNTDPNGLVKLFSQRVYDWPVNALSGLMQHQVILFKSCYPASNITSDEQLEQYRAWYLGMRDMMDRHLDHLFIVVTSPPLNPSETTPEAAARAREFANWLQSDSFLQGHPNVRTIDLFGLLSEGDATSPTANMLRAEYRTGDDSHPNEQANQEVGPVFADLILEAVQSYWTAWDTIPSGVGSRLTSAN